MALVAPTRSAARAAAARLPRRALAHVRPIPMTVADYLRACRSRPPLRLLLAESDDPAFARATRDRLLWTRPAPEVYAAISGLRTDLPPLPRPGRGSRTGASASRRRASAEPYLLLEGVVTAARAARALDSPVRNWVVEHVGLVRIGERGLSRLAANGVRWSVLWPVERMSLRRAASAPAR
jgi:hypothetical protein